MNKLGKIDYLEDLGFIQDKKYKQLFERDLLNNEYLQITFPSTNEDVLEMNEFARFYCFTHVTYSSSKWLPRNDVVDSQSLIFDTFEEFISFLFSNLDPFHLNCAFLEQTEYIEPYYKKCEKCRTKIHHYLVSL